MEYLRTCERDAERLVHTHWAAIEALAGALIERETLTGDEAVSIVNGKLSSEVR